MGVTFGSTIKVKSLETVTFSVKKRKCPAHRPGISVGLGKTVRP